MNSVQAYPAHQQARPVEDATWCVASSGGDNYLWKGTLVYNGVVYDHIRYRTRGGSAWRYAMGKNTWKFDFNHNHELQVTDDYGKPYNTKWEKLSLAAHHPAGQLLAPRRAGPVRVGRLQAVQPRRRRPPTAPTSSSSASSTTPPRPAPTSTSGDLWGLYLAVEQSDGHFLDEHGLPDGNIYDMEGGTGTLNNQGPTAAQRQVRPEHLPQHLHQHHADRGLVARQPRPRRLLRLPHHRRGDPPLRHRPGRGQELLLLPRPRHQTSGWSFPGTWTSPGRTTCTAAATSRSRSACCREPGVQPRIQERASANIRDLLYNPDQAGQVIDEMAAKIYTPGPAVVRRRRPRDVGLQPDHWTTRNRTYGDKGGAGRFYKGNPAAGVLAGDQDLQARARPAAGRRAPRAAGRRSAARPGAAASSGTGPRRARARARPPRAARRPAGPARWRPGPAAPALHARR